MKTMMFPSPQDAEAAFYEAFERADLSAMMAVWAEDEDIVCIHPGGPRLAGMEQIRDGWRRIFANGPSLRFQLSGQQIVRDTLLAVHSVHENVTGRGERSARPPIIATNIYLLTERGWRMVMHHASPTTDLPESANEQTAIVLH